MAKLNIQAANQQQMLQNLSTFADNVKDNDVVAAGKKEGIYGDASNHGKKAAFRTAKGDRQRLVSQLKTLGEKHFQNDPGMKKTWESGLKKFAGKNGQYSTDVKGSEFREFVKDMVQKYKQGQKIQVALDKCVAHGLPLGADAYTSHAQQSMDKGDYQTAAKTLDQMKEAFPGKLDFLGSPKKKVELQEYKKMIPVKINNAPAQSKQPSLSEIQAREAALSLLVKDEANNVSKPIFQKSAPSQGTAANENAKMNYPGVSAQDVADFDQIANVISDNITPGGPADWDQEPVSQMNNSVVDANPNLKSTADIHLESDIELKPDEDEIEGAPTPGDYKGNMMVKVSYYIDENQVEGH